MTTLPKPFSSFETRGAKDADPATASLVEDIARARETDYCPLRSNPYVPAGGASTVKPASTRNDKATPWPNTISTLGNSVRRRMAQIA